MNILNAVNPVYIKSGQSNDADANFYLDLEDRNVYDDMDDGYAKVEDSKKMAEFNKCGAYATNSDTFTDAHFYDTIGKEDIF